MSVNIEDIKKANADAGKYWFSPGALEFFDSRIGTAVYGVWRDGRPGGQYFVTSEKNEVTPRRYTVRRYDPVTHDITSASGFMEYKTSIGASKRAMRERDREQETGEWEGKP